MARPGLDGKQRKRLDRLVARAQHAELVELAAELDPILVCVPRPGATPADQDWEVVDGIRADARAYLLGRMQRDNEVRSRRGLELDLQACHDSYWQAAHTAAEVGHLLERVAASPDRSGRDVDAVYRTAILEHRKLLGDLSAGLARMRAEQELGRAQSRRVDTADAPIVADRADRDAAVRMARADLFGVEAIGPLQVPPAELEVPAERSEPEAVAVAVPARRRVTGPRPKKPAASPSRPARPPLILQDMSNTVPARQVRSLSAPHNDRKFDLVEVAEGHVLYAHAEGEWSAFSGSTRLEQTFDSYWLVDPSWSKVIKWNVPVPGGGKLGGSSALFVLDGQVLAATCESGALLPDALDQFVADAATECVKVRAAGLSSQAEQDAWREADRAWLESFRAVVTDRSATALAAMGLGIAEVQVWKPRFPAQRRRSTTESASSRARVEQLVAGIDEDIDRFQRACGETLPRPDRRLTVPVLEATAAYIRLAAATVECIQRGETAQGNAATIAGAAWSTAVSNKQFSQAMGDSAMAGSWSRFIQDAQEAFSRGMVVAATRAQAMVASPASPNASPEGRAIAATAPPTHTPDTSPGDGTPAGSAAVNSDPVQRLRRLNELLSAGLIQQDEFDAKRAEIIAAI